MIPVFLPPYALQEWESITRAGGDPYPAWLGGPPDTAFRRDMLPYRDHDDPAFRIIVPVSGGIDSATCWQMATMAGLPVEAVVIDTGVPYSRHDRAAAERLTEGRLTVLQLPDPPSWTTIREVQIGRNSAIVWRLAEWARDHGWWGEIWFGNLGGNYLETPVVGGDKSFRWGTGMQHLLTAAGFDLRLTSPLTGMSKADAVTWWHARGRADTLLRMRSCFADIPDHCGTCWACLYRYVAFAARGLEAEVAATYRHGIDFISPAADFWDRLEPLHGVTTHPARLTEVFAVLNRLRLGPDEVRARLQREQAATQPDAPAYRPTP